MEQIDAVERKKTRYPANAIFSIVCTLIFYLILYVLPVIGASDRSSSIYYFLRYPAGPILYLWDGVQLPTIFRPYDQWAGLVPFPETGYITTTEHAFLYGLMFWWHYPFILLGTLGAFLIILPPFFSLLKIELPRFPTIRKFGFIAALFGLAVQWSVFFLLWLLTLPDRAHFSGVMILLSFIGLVILYLGHVIWEGGATWKRDLEAAITSTGFYLFVIAVVIYCVFPFFWALIQSLQDAAFLRGIEYLPLHPTYENYVQVFEIFPFHHNIANSLIVSSLTTVLCVGIGAFGGYVIAQFRFRTKRIILGAILSMTMFPALVILVPLFLEYLWIGDNLKIKLTDNLIGLLIPYITFNLPLTLFLLQNFFEEIPSELVKAARVDGACNFQVFRQIILPLAIPGVFTTAILVFIAAWNEFLFANLLLNEPNWTIPVVMVSFEGIGRVSGYNANLLLSAATVIVTLPLILLVLAFQRQIVSGITAGAVKG